MNDIINNAKAALLSAAVMTAAIAVPVLTILAVA